MKKLLVAALVVLSVVAIAVGQQVLSRNAVGYQKVTLEKGKFAMARHDFETLDTPLVISNVFASLPAGSRVMLWKEDQSGYIVATKTILGTWGAAGSNVLARGRGFWVQVATTAPSNTYDVFMMGEVPDKFTAPTTTVNVLAGFTLTGYGYPTEIKWTNTTVAKSAPAGSTIFIWTGSNYVPYTRTVLGWTGGATNLLLTPGMGFWLRWASATNWAEGKPYTWP